MVHPELQLLNSYDLTWPFIVLLGAFRIICRNGLVVGKSFYYLRKRHIQDLDRMNLSDQMSTALSRLEMQAQEWKQWTRQQLTAKAYTLIMEAMQFGIEATEEIENRIVQEAADCDDLGFPVITLWAFFNVLTWYTSHRAVSLNHAVQMERRLRVALEACKN